MLNVICLKGGSEMKEIYKYFYVIALVLLVAGFGQSSISQDRLPCEDLKLCYVEIDIFEFSDPSSTNCNSDESVVSVIIKGDTLYNEMPEVVDEYGQFSFSKEIESRDFSIDEIDEQSLKLASTESNEVHVKTDGTKVRHEDGTRLEFHTKIKLMDIDRTRCGKQVIDLIGKIKGTDIKIQGVGEINLVGGNTDKENLNGPPLENPACTNKKETINNPNCQ